LQDALNHHVFHPLAWRLARSLEATPVTPNMVSIAGGLIVVAAAFAYVQPGWPLPALVGLFLHLSWHVIDGADGDLARITGRSGPSGELVDGICDYASHIVLYIALGLLLQSQIGPWSWALTIGAGISRIVQANHYEVQRRQYQWWMYAVPWLRVSGTEKPHSVTKFGGAYLRLARLISPDTRAIDGAFVDANSDLTRIEYIRSVVRNDAVAMLSSFHFLSANYRMLCLGLSMLAGSPLYYFLYEAVALNLVLLRSMVICREGIRHITAQIDYPVESTRR
jgi:phosphatidylglycerophosphate synthase